MLFPLEECLCVRAKGREDYTAREPNVLFV